MVGVIPFFISGAEIAFILFIVLLVFGADKVPEIARGLGKGMRQIKNATTEIKSEITKGAQKQGIDLNVTENLKDEINEIKNVKDEVEDTFGTIKRKF